MSNVSFQVILAGALPYFLGSKNKYGLAKANWSLGLSHRKNSVSFAMQGIDKYYGGDKKVEGIQLYGSSLSIYALYKSLKIFTKNLTLINNLTTRDKCIFFLSLYSFIHLKSKLQFSILHIQHVSSFLVMIARLVAPETIIIVSMHDLWKNSKRALNNYEVEVINKQLQHADQIVWIAKHLKHCAIEQHIEWSIPDCIIPNGVNLEVIEETEIIEDQIIFAGTITERKGIKFLCEATKYLDKEVKRFVWAGTGAISLDNYSNLIQYKFTGYLESGPLLREIQQSKLLVVPSNFEPFGLVYLESLWAGTPIIGYSASVLELQKEFDPEVRHWFIPFDPHCQGGEELAYLIKNNISLKKSDEFNKERQLIRKTLLEKYSWDKISLQYNELYYSMFERRMKSRNKNHPYNI
ncbi:MAG: glycosyltransferase family 4 protein [Sporocytophaga sp.]|uniref:glycosyltransferase family 4 protein n=1 Tax=Sporocytophaga sp. TaxID=2231183 RepID=UPI001B0CC4AB|nr:glycosyltransferase family 4 protein [Sporocytophaga sp.]MBO9699300.1 glycosyltransferase family 4 protein [Sporocytophaga sp.]